MSDTCHRQPDAYIKPRYPVDEPPTYRAQCSCGWTGPERYRGITDTDWHQHAEEDRPVTAEGNAANDGLREAVEARLSGPPRLVAYVNDAQLWGLSRVVDAVLALPELAALRAKAAAVDRVRELAEELGTHTVEPETDADRAFIRGLDLAADRIRRALDGPASC